MKHACAGVILSGGLNKRMGGKNKALLSLAGQTILDRLQTAFEGLFDEVLLVTKDPLAYLPWDLKIVTDLLPTRSSLTGIHAALFHVSTPYAFITACDTPFLKTGLIRILLDELKPKWDVVMPVTEQGNQPLCAIYSKRCIEPIEDQLRNGDPRILNFFPKIKVKEIPEKRLRQADPELISFFNINKPEDLKACEKML
ncbi:MAG: molybdenum cofactor guanylyltransferase [Deltaproteobacteria bacterium]|nr:molybdenum cofactor guanylyltransferase [Deltaproteobacteria bacterium]MBW2172035.1 molybdenum cofactor guanylyltransferase [Deltaproteobacteria bacterium]